MKILTTITIALVTLACIALLAGCEEPIVTKTTDMGTRQAVARCYKFGSCYTCRYHCGFHLSSNCPGYQNVTVHVKQLIYHYKSEPNQDYTKEETQIVSIDSVCQ